MWLDLWPWLLGALVVFLAAAALWLALRRPQPAADPDLHGQALERWLAGDLAGARELLRQVVAREPHRNEPYLQLGVLLRLTGDPGRAAALHRGLAVRPDLSPGRRVTVGLELAADLIDLERCDEAATVLSQLSELAHQDERWYRLRFAAAVGRDDVDEARLALQAGAKKLRGERADSLRALHAAWLSDRALMHLRAGEVAQARDMVQKAKGLEPAAGRKLLIRALIAAEEKDSERAVRAVAEGLSAYPAEMAPVLGLLEGALLETGRFTLVVPILEEACRDDAAPPALWMALARLYEKLGRRDEALRLLAGKRGDPRLTPDAAAPYLRLLTAEVPDAAFSKVWNLLSEPGADHGLDCRHCGRHERQWRWFCPDCLSPDSFVIRVPAVPSPVHTPAAPPVGPPRF